MLNLMLAPNLAVRSPYLLILNVSCLVQFKLSFLHYAVDKPNPRAAVIISSNIQHHQHLLCLTSRRVFWSNYLIRMGQPLVGTNCDGRLAMEDFGREKHAR